MNNIENRILMPPPNSTMANEIDSLYYFILWCSTAIFAIVVFFIIYFCVKYRSESIRDKKEEQVSHNTKLEIFWTLIPTILIIIVFFWGATSFIKMQIYPNDSKQINVIASNYQFKFKYPYDNKMFSIADSLVVPQGKPIRLLMTATRNSFIHSLYIPNFRVKQDVMANRYSQIWFQSNDIGTYDYYCTEYCGIGHSGMNGYVVVMPEFAEKFTDVNNNQKYDLGEKFTDENNNNLWDSGYDYWVKRQIVKHQESMNLTGAEKGAYLYEELACNTCHSTNKNEIIIGPSFRGQWAWGETIIHTDQSAQLVDENYVENSIRYPGNKIVEGFTNQMPKDYVKLPQEDIGAIIEFIKSLK